MFVVDRRATGEDMVRMSTGLSVYRILADRPGTEVVVGEVSLLNSLTRFDRSVNALDNDDIVHSNYSTPCRWPNLVTGCFGCLFGNIHTSIG